MSYSEDVRSYQYLDEDIKLYTRLLTDNDYKFKLNEDLKTIKGLNINSYVDFIRHQVQLQQLKNSNYNDIISYERLQNQERLDFVIEKYLEQNEQSNIIKFNPKRQK